MFYTSILNNTLLLQQPFIFLISKLSYDMIYYKRIPSTKIITAIMCFLGATKMVEFLYNNYSNMTKYISFDKFKNIKNADIDEISDVEDAKLTEYNNRSNISGITNDLDRLLEQSTTLCAEKKH